MIESLVFSVALVALVLIGAFLYEVARRLYYWSASRLLGWTKEEKFERETAWIDREAAREEHLANRDTTAAGNAARRRLGVSLITMTVLALMFRAQMQWWEIAVYTSMIYAGATMASGLAWKAW